VLLLIIVDKLYTTQHETRSNLFSSRTLPFYRLLRDKANASTYGYIPEIALILAVGASYAFWPGSLIAVGEWIQYVLWTYFIGLLCVSCCY
jgi:hypothetical protein